MFPSATGALKDEVQAAPLSRKAKSALLEEEAAFLELPPVRPRTTSLPATATKNSPARRKAKHKREQRREQRRKEKHKKRKGKGEPEGTGHPASFSGKMCSATSSHPEWTRVDFVIDSGASATTIPKELVGKVTLGGPRGYSSFKLANGAVVLNEGTLSTKAWLMGNETMEVRMSVADISQRLMSVGQMISSGKKVVLSPKVSYLETKSGGIHRIFQKNGVYVLPVWLDSAKMASRQPIGKVVHFDGQEEEQDDLFLDWIFGDPEDGVPSDEHGMAEAEEGRAAKPIKSPSLPSPEEIEAHAVSHTLQAVVLSLC